ncbi:ExbD/TolR family protein [Cellvibrio japonicus]|uniref:Putative adventurous gliding motility protein S n=1 Tax=Cellvibrio japonicus (strain Ueda107) TaxID=498211 RepID=B3PEL1_CELJU|nr:biopolymer transporter ExbD [Cellvibrio japonicus]ACE84828.1 putative adventurous gliding motility protein S [Cellvibrio japonicus Ueda107]QEI13567.1 biopolymer transporter ExbD [Cellvibrio japonicus]QEI17141.1 biopolymer transporter ExbD [Cellvibrio japonicus]QEI20718.1 biopolymer transporter ExbD [Cellvibrio japonicus]
MKQSLRAKRMAKHHRRLNQVPKLNLVSLMDIFTILVFFLLVNSGDVEVLQTDKSIKLPASVSDQLPEDNLVVLVSATDVIVGGRSVGSIAALTADTADQFAPLTEELKYQAQKAGPLKADQQITGRPVTIMADQKVPYHLLKKIMATCAGAEYRDISLAVTQKEVSADEAGEG